MTKNEQLMALQKRQQQIEKELAWIKRQVVMAAEQQTSESVKAGATTASTCDCAVALASDFSRQQPPCRNVIPYGSIIEDCNPNDTSPLLVRYENNCRASRSSSSSSSSLSRRDQEKQQSAAPPGTPPEHIMLFDSGGHLEWDECFSHVRSEEDLENEKVHNESDLYLKSSMFARAIPERLFALLVTMILEIPVLLMISGGSDALCMLIGRRRYQLLIGFLPLTSAISGNVGLQASTLTTRAISHLHVTPENYLVWLGTEIGASVYLGAGMGFFLGSVAFWAAGMDMSFGLTIATAQILSILTAGCTGTLAPLLFSFIFRRDSGKWGGPLETAVQDIVGSFAMVVVSYRILLWLGPGPIRPDDVCGVS